MTTSSTTSPPLPESCPCCGDKVHNADDLIAFEMYTAGPETPKEELLRGVCDICGETRPKRKKPITGRIVYTRAATGEFLREEYRCEGCFEKFRRRHNIIIGE
jgi:hypothetical protein